MIPPGSKRGNTTDTGGAFGGLVAGSFFVIPSSLYFMALSWMRAARASGRNSECTGSGLESKLPRGEVTGGVPPTFACVFGDFVLMF